MREGRASRTAEHNALFRALEHALPAIPRNVRFVASDLTERDLEERMARAGRVRRSTPFGRSSASRRARAARQRRPAG